MAISTTIDFLARNVQFDYTNQAWLVNGVYVPCGHRLETDCRCFGKLHAGEPAREGAEIA